MNISLNYYNSKASMVPKPVFFGHIDGDLVIVTKFIEGISYSSYGEMPEEVKKACEMSLRNLYKKNVLHGDLDPRLFIFNSKGLTKI